MIATQTIEPKAKEYSPTAEDFAALLDESLSGSAPSEGAVVKGKIVAIEKDLAVIDVGLKTEGRVPLKEFALPGQAVHRPSRRRGGSLCRAHRERRGRGCAQPREGPPRG